MASGMKRAYKIKDFSQSLPGHGGFVDRFDCITCLTIFAYTFLTQVHYKDYFKQEDSYALLTEKFSDSDKNSLLEWMGNLDSLK